MEAGRRTRAAFARPGSIMTAPSVKPIAARDRPLWSVMIPTYNCGRYLAETLRSVLAQDRGPDHMHIEVVDHASTEDDPAAVVEEIGKGRVAFWRKEPNEGAIANFNACISRSQGVLVHILHGDDYVADGFYRTIERIAAEFPEVGLYATRNFTVDEDSIVTGVSRRIPALEAPTQCTRPFFYETPVQFAGVVVRRTAYEALGGFRPDLIHAADCEMWARITHAHGSILAPDVLAFYRVFSANDTGRLAQTAENVRDYCRLASIFSSRYSDFSDTDARTIASNRAWKQYRAFRLSGNEAAASANYDLWRELTPVTKRMKRHVRTWATPLLQRNG
jgi:glycosyltransferase involved in cell wall biosynthesis